MRPQHRARLGRSEGEIVEAYLGHRTGQPIPVQRQREVDPGEHDHPQAGTGMPEEKVDAVQDSTAAEHLGVVEDEDDRLGSLRERRHESDEKGMADRLVEGRRAYR